MGRSAWSGILIGVLASAAAAGADDGAVKPAHSQKGTVQFRLQGGQKNIPQRYRLEEHSFAYEMVLKRDLPNSGVEIYQVRFPSPLTSACPENNTVYADADFDFSETWLPRMTLWICCIKSGSAPGECGMKMVLLLSWAPISLIVSRYCVTSTSIITSLAVAPSTARCTSFLSRRTRATSARTRARP